jgi:hypothetical protein
MSWFNVLNIFGLWNAGTPIPVDEDNPLPVVEARETGVWGYESGVSGTPTLPVDCRILQISAIGGAAASITIDGGDTITIPIGSAITIEPRGNLVEPVIVFTNTVSFFVEYLV